MTLPTALLSGALEALASLSLEAFPADDLAGEAPAPNQWSRRIPLTIAVLGFAASMCWLMLTGWRRRAARQEVDLPTLPPVPAHLSRPILEPVQAYYVGTTTAGAWLDRIAARGLDARGDAVVTLSEEGLLIRRLAAETASPIFLPAAKLRGARTDRALAGKVVGADGMLLVTWTHGGSDLDTGLIAEDRSLGPVYAEAITRLVERTEFQTEAAPYSANVAPAAGAEAVQEPLDPEPEAEPTPRSAPQPEPAPVPAVDLRPDADEAEPESEPEPELYWGEDVPVDETAATTPAAVPAAPPAAPPAPPPAVPTPEARPGAAALVGLAPPPALLVLEDGRVFRGSAYGARGETFGEAVFNTGMTGYQETLTDPSYHRQVVVMTAPHIGNTGVNDEDPESARIWVAGYVVRDPARVTSNWRSQRSLDDELAAAGVVGIAGVDTRALTRHLRERGAMRVGVSSEVDGTEGDVAALLERVRASPGMAGADLAGEVTTSKPYVVPATGEKRFRVAALDLGIKRSTPRYLAAAGCDVVVLPAHATAEELLAVRPDGVFVSNGPGDPATADGPVAALRGVLDAGMPVFGICFGNQVLGRALGLGTYKLVYGHRGVNQPVQDRATGRVAITSHNHGFAVDADPTGPVDTPYGRVEVSHIDLNDGVVEGLRCLDVPAFSVQYHPEAAPGPHDANGLFASFADLMESRRTPEVAADGPPDAPRSPSHDPEA